MATAMRAAIYVRMSTEQQDDSPARQRSLINPYITPKGYVVVHEYEDLAGKGWDENRSGLQQMIRDAQAGKFDVIVVDEWSRLTRADFFVTVSEIIKPLRDCKVVLDTVRDGVKNWNDIAGQVMLVVDTHRSESETRETARRTLSQLMQTAREGKLFLGPTPYGYKAEEEDGAKGRKKRTKLIIGDPTEVEAVRWIYNSCVYRGLGITAMATELTKQGYASPDSSRGWHPSTVRGILMNPVYAGHYRFNSQSRRRFAFFQEGKLQLASSAPSKKHAIHKNKSADIILIRNTHEPIIGQELWDEAQEMRQSRAKAPAHQRRSVRTLSGVLHCYHCKRVMYHAKILKKHRWRCATEMRRLPNWGDCKCYQIDDELAVNHVLGLIREYLFNATNLKKCEKAIAKKYANDSNEDVIKSTKRRLAQVEKRIGNGYDNLTETPKHMAGRLLETISKLEVEAQQLRDQLAAAGHNPVEDFRVYVRYMQEAYHDVEKHMKEGNHDLANFSLRKFVDAVYVHFETHDSASGKKQWHVPVQMTLEVRQSYRDGKPSPSCYVTSVSTGPCTHGVYTLECAVKLGV